MAKQTITVETDEDKPEPIELIARSIERVANGFEAMDRGRLSRRAIVILIQDETGLSKSQINAVLDASVKLKDLYLKKVKAN